jgi:hypothetical protein
VGHGKMGGKSEDDRLISLCRKHHNEFHSIGRKTFSEKYNLDAEHIIRRLNEIWFAISNQIDMR